MPPNPFRRGALADAGLAVLAAEGARGLTHRAVDRRAGVPIGTTSNYFRSRAELVGALVERIGERLAPDEASARGLASRPPTLQLFEDYMVDLVDRLLGAPEVTLALFELRLEGTRRGDVGDVLARWRRRAYRDAMQFTREAGLPAGPAEVEMLHYAIEGLAFDSLTGPLEPDGDPRRQARALTAALLSSG